jgi:hypothetical protein
MDSYLAYGLRISSAIPMSRLMTSSEGDPDVFIRWGSVFAVPPVSEADVSGAHFRVAAQGIFFFWEDFGTILVRNGREIIVDQGRAMDEQELEATILGPAFAALLHQRARFVLHASAVALGDEAFAFIGETQQGKSTLALALYALGNELVADDITSVDLTSSGPLVSPAYPGLNVWPEALTALSYDPTPLERVEVASEKRSFPASERFYDRPLVLRGIYELSEGEFNVIQRLAPREAFKALCSHSYCLKFTRYSEAATHLSQSAALLKAVPIFRLRVCRALASITDLAELVQKDVNTRRKSGDKYIA